VTTDLSLAGLFVSGFLSSTLLPGGSEIALAWGVHTNAASLTTLWLVATLGNALGGFSGWLLGRWIAVRYPARGLSRPRHRRAVTLIRRRGSPLLLLSWLPVIGDPLCVAAGWLEIKWPPALFYITMGKAGRYAALLLLLNGI